jgi:Tfp pilus assembly protein PilO
VKRGGKPMPRAAVLGMIVGGALLVAIAGYMLLVKPQQAKLTDVKAQIDEKQQTLDQYTAEAANRQDVPKIRVADVYRLARAMPATQNMPDILIELDQLARDAGIQLSTIAPQPAMPGNGFQIVPISLQFSGDYYSVTDLLYRLRTLVSVRHGQLEAAGRIFSVQSITLQPSGSRLDASVTVNTYIYGGTPAPAAPTVAPSTTDTSATTTTTDTTATTTAETPPEGASAQGAP